MGVVSSQVGSCFIPLKKIAIDSPGYYYYTLVPKKVSGSPMPYPKAICNIMYIHY